MIRPPLAEALDLEPHPEGGWFRQTFAPSETITLPDGRIRPAATLEQAPVDQADPAQPFRLLVQWVNRPNQDFRGFAGTLAAGTVAPGDEVVVTRADHEKRGVSCWLTRRCSSSWPS